MADFHLKLFVPATYAELTLKQCVRTSMVVVSIWTLKKTSCQGTIMYLALAVEFVSEKEYYFVVDFCFLTFETVAIVAISGFGFPGTLISSPVCEDRFAKY